MTEREQTEHVLVCVECAGEAPPSAVGWRAVLVVDDEDSDGALGVAVYCPTCAAMEYGWP